MKELSRIVLTKDEIRLLTYILENDIHDMNNQLKEYPDDDQITEEIEEETMLLNKLNKILEHDLHESLYKDELYKKAINRLKRAGKIKNVEDTYNAIVYLEQEIDLYRSKIARLEFGVLND